MHGNVLVFLFKQETRPDKSRYHYFWFLDIKPCDLFFLKMAMWGWMAMGGWTDVSYKERLQN